MNKQSKLYILFSICCWNFSLALSKELPLPNFITEGEFDAARILEATTVPDPSRNYDQINKKPDTFEGKIGTRNFLRNNIWPNGRIPYTVNVTMCADARLELAKAFDDFHTKTCIRFVPKQDSDVAFVDMQRDDAYCGLAIVCRTGGAQWAKFGSRCSDARTMVHELGHSICMSHEQDRPDRDNYVRFEGCDGGTPGDLSWWTNPSLYDYYSVMQYDGGWQGACLQSKMNLPDKWFGNPGRLSVLDAEKINARYECGGCLSYRWKSFDEITSEDYLEPVDPGSTALHICRFYVNGEIIVGKASVGQKSCWVPYKDGEIGSGGSQKFEVLTNPQRIPFRWVQMTKGGEIPAGSVAGGRKTTTGQYGVLPETYYIARCALQPLQGMLHPGSLHAASSTMFVSTGFRSYECENFEVLTCTEP